MNPPTFPAFSLNTSGLATLILDPVLDPSITPSPASTPVASKA